MKKSILHIVLFFSLITQLHSQENGVVAFTLPVRNSLKFNKYALNPRSGRLIKKSTALYRKLVKLGEIIEDEEDDTTKTAKPEMIMMKPQELEKTIVMNAEKTYDDKSRIEDPEKSSAGTGGLQPLRVCDPTAFPTISNDMKKKLDKELRDKVRARVGIMDKDEKELESFITNENGTAADVDVVDAPGIIYTVLYVRK